MRAVFSSLSIGDRRSSRWKARKKGRGSSNSVTFSPVISAHDRVQVMLGATYPDTVQGSIRHPSGYRERLVLEGGVSLKSRCILHR